MEREGKTAFTCFGAEDGILLNRLQNVDRLSRRENFSWRPSGKCQNGEMSIGCFYYLPFWSAGFVLSAHLVRFRVCRPLSPGDARADGWPSFLQLFLGGENLKRLSQSGRGARVGGTWRRWLDLSKAEKEARKPLQVQQSTGDF